MNLLSNAATPLQWGQRADRAQGSFDHFFGTEPPQLFNNLYPVTGADDNATFNYWWLAHAIDARLDAFERSGDASWLEQAVQVFDNLVERNGGQYFNDYFDDMLWLALAAFRMSELGAGDRYSTTATDIWSHVIEFGWNDQLGASLAWRKQQLAYKNTPANGPLIILSLRLHRWSGDAKYLHIAQQAIEWLDRELVDPRTGFVEDGINRLDDGAVDTQWRFTYNQGLYVGACVEFFRSTGETDFLHKALKTARVAIAELSEDGVFRDEGDGGDEGLFQGVYFRYLGQLLQVVSPEERVDLEGFVLEASEQLWQNCVSVDGLLASKDWRRAATLPVHYSTQLSAIMAVELAARISTDETTRARY